MKKRIDSRYENLSFSSSVAVRMEAARNGEYLSMWSLIRLSSDESVEVRKIVAACKRTPRSALNRMMSSDVFEVRELIAKRLDAPDYFRMSLETAIVCESPGLIETHDILSRIEKDGGQALLPIILGKISEEHLQDSALKTRITHIMSRIEFE